MEAEPRSRNTWVIVAAVLAVLACCCVLMAAVLAGGLLWVTPLERYEMDSGGGKRSWQHYEVGEAPTLRIDNFAGSIQVRAGEEGAIEVVAHKQARRKGDLERIEVDIKKRDGGLVIKTRKPPGVSNAWVQFEITAPAGTSLDAHTGAGSMRVAGLNGGVRADSGSGGLVIIDAQGDVDADTGSGSIEVRNVQGRATVNSGSGSLSLVDVIGEIDAHTGSGSIEVRNASGPVRLETGSGGIQYDGSPQGDCRFQTGSGGISLTLPADLDMEIDLHTGSGRIDIDYEVTGPVQVSKTEVKGVIGSGEDGRIRAHTGSGSIRLSQR